MARSGRFGRLPRSAPDLTGEVIAMLREYERVREQTLLTAWNEGGTFEGKKVTDQMVLDFYRQKTKDVSKDDPLYEHYKNTVQQFEFEIAESKKILWYEQNKGNTTESKRAAAQSVAAFYRSWAQKVPRHSEVYRDLMRNAASFANSFRATAKKETEADKRQRYERQSRRLYNEYEKEAIRVESLLTKFMRGAGYLAGAAGTVGQEGDVGEYLPDVTGDVDPATGTSDVSAMLLLFDALQDDNKYRRRMGNLIGKGERLSRNDFVQMLKRRNAGLNERIKLAKRMGYRSDIPSLLAQRTANQRQIAATRLYDETERVAEIRTNLDSDLNSPESSFGDMVEAMNTAVDGLISVRKDVMRTPGQANSPLLGEINNDIKQFTSTNDPAQGGPDNQFLATLEALENGEAGIVYGPDNSDAYGATPVRGWEVVPFATALQTMGGDYVVQSKKMAGYNKYTAKTSKNAAKQFEMGGDIELEQVEGYTYAEFLRVVPVHLTANDVSARTGNLFGQGTAVMGDTLIGKAALDADGNIVGMGAYNDLGQMHWVYGASPFRKNAYTNTPELSADGQSVVLNANLAEGSPVNVMRNKAGDVVGVVPVSVVDPTIMPGIAIVNEEGEATGEYSDGSQWTSEVWAVARAFSNGENATQTMSMTNEDWQGLMELDPRYKNGNDEDRAELDAALNRDVSELRAAQKYSVGSNWQDSLADQRAADYGGTWREAEERASTSAVPPSEALSEAAQFQQGVERDEAAFEQRFGTPFGTAGQVEPTLETGPSVLAARMQEQNVMKDRAAHVADMANKTRGRIFQRASSVFAPQQDPRGAGETIKAPAMPMTPFGPGTGFGAQPQQFAPTTPTISAPAAFGLPGGGVKPPPMFAPGTNRANPAAPKLFDPMKTLGAQPTQRPITPLSPTAGKRTGNPFGRGSNVGSQGARRGPNY